MPTAQGETDRKWNVQRETVYESHYVAMPDGTRLAVDVVRPKSSAGDCTTDQYHTAFIQCRYMRGVATRWPYSIWSGHRPVDFINQDLKVALLKAGYAVVSIDVRGTGASYGKWRMLWSPEEVDDSLHILDWILQQTWSSGQVALCGMSYEAAAALFTLSRCPPGVKAAVLRFPFWNPFMDISCPGGIPQQKFAKNWTAVTQALDADDVGGLSWLLRPFFRGCQPVVEAPQPSTSVFSYSYWKSWLRYHRAEAEGASQLRRAVEQHQNFNPAKALETGRFPEQVDEQSQLSIKQVSVCHQAEQIRRANVPMLLMAGWLDATAAPAITCFTQAAKAPGSHLIIGPWTHGGLSNNPVGHNQKSTKSHFNQVGHVVQFLDHIMAGGAQPDVKPKADSSYHNGKIGEVAQPMDGSAIQLGEHVAVSAGTGQQHADKTHHALSQGRSAVLEAATDAIIPSTVAESPFTADQGDVGLTGDSRRIFNPGADAVQWFCMGDNAGWRSSPAWPHGNTKSLKSTFLLSGKNGDSEGLLAATAPTESLAWHHSVEAWKHPKGQSRYECMTDLRTPMVYRGLDSCGHLSFTSAPLEDRLEFVGWPVVELWVSSCDDDADLFCYLESFDPVTGDVAYITEGTFRASHRKPLAVTDDGPQPDLPAHSYEAQDVEPLRPGVPALCQFTLLPTAFAFSKGHCVRLAVSGSDTKHYSCDRACDGSRSIAIHSTPEQPSLLKLP